MPTDREDVRVVVLTALEVEFRAVVQFLRERSTVVHRIGTVYELGKLETPEGPISIAVAQVGAGNVKAAVEAERALTFFNPELLLFVGVAGGIKDVRIGDVVAATKVYGYESGKEATELLTRPDVGEASYSVQQCAMDVARTDAWLNRLPRCPGATPQALIGPIAAGEKVVASAGSTTFLLLRDRFSDALAVEMEGRGTLAGAFAHTHVAAGVVRGISDLIERKEDADAAGGQSIASTRAAAFAAEVISRFCPRPKSRAATRPGERGEDAWWAAVLLQGSQLYPMGPGDHDIWIRSGGDVARLSLNDDGRTQWGRALRALKQGGGGASMSAVQLLSVMLEDFPRNMELKALIGSAPRHA